MSLSARPELGFRLGMAACGLGIGSYVVAALTFPLGANLSRHVGWYLVAFAFYLAAVTLVLPPKRDGAEKRTARAELAAILAWAALLRVGLLFTTPSLSDDVFRYLWDGKVVTAGIDPYLYPPSAPELAHLRDRLWEGINHKSMATPYPPLAEALFAAVYWVAPGSLAAMQAAAVALDLGVIALLVPMLARFGLDPRRVLVYAWNPLVLLQFAHSAHYDAAMLLPLLGAIYLLHPSSREQVDEGSWGHPPAPWTRSRCASGALLGLATLVKLVPLVAAPPFVPFLGVGGLLAMALVTSVGLLPWLAGGTALGGLVSEASDARFNDSLGFLLMKLLGPVAPDPEVAARTLSAVVLLASSLLVAGLLWKRRADWKMLLKATYWLLGLFILLNAVAEPWYLTWMVPFLGFTLAPGPRGLPRLDPALGWLLLSGFIVLTDLTYSPQFGTSAWWWVRTVEYGPLYGLLALWAWRRFRAQ